LAKSGKIGKNTEGVTSGCFDEKYDCKKNKKSCFDDYKKNKKIKKTPAPNTALPHIPPQKPTHKAQCGGTSAVQSFCTMKKKTVLQLNKRK
jgi:hypothetical protein